MLDQAQAQVGFICGAAIHTARRLARSAGRAGHARAARYGDRPIYFSDIVVRHDSPFESFCDLRGATWAYNEPDSWSGCVALRAHIAAHGATRATAGGSSSWARMCASLRMIVEGAIDAAAIDSTVLELDTGAPAGSWPSQIRVVESIGPNPIPPAVVRREVPDAIKQQLRNALLQMHEDRRRRRRSWRTGMVARFSPISRCRLRRHAPQSPPGRASPVRQ